ncbi:MAG: hypothetical protein U1E52_12520 [Geminicoccaceae bacterium]
MQRLVGGHQLAGLLVAGAEQRVGLEIVAAVDLAHRLPGDDRPLVRPQRELCPADHPQALAFPLEAPGLLGQQLEIARALLGPRPLDRLAELLRHRQQRRAWWRIQLRQQQVDRAVRALGRQ